jgi:hypothetical protein
MKPDSRNSDEGVWHTYRIASRPDFVLMRESQ